MSDDRMTPRADLAVCTVGDQTYYGSPNEYDAARLSPGDRVRYEASDGRRGEGVVELVWFYEGLMVDLEGGGSLWAVHDRIEKVGAP